MVHTWSCTWLLTEDTDNILGPCYFFLKYSHSLCCLRHKFLLKFKTSLWSCWLLALRFYRKSLKYSLIVHTPVQFYLQSCLSNNNFRILDSLGKLETELVGLDSSLGCLRHLAKVRGERLLGTKEASPASASWRHPSSQTVNWWVRWR